MGGVVNVQAIYTKPRPPYIPLKEWEDEEDFGDPNKEGGGFYRLLVVGENATHLDVVAFGFLPKSKPAYGTVPIGWPEEMGMEKAL